MDVRTAQGVPENNDEQVFCLQDKIYKINNNLIYYCDIFQNHLPQISNLLNQYRKDYAFYINEEKIGNLAVLCNNLDLSSLVAFKSKCKRTLASLEYCAYDYGATYNEALSIIKTAALNRSLGILRDLDSYTQASPDIAALNGISVNLLDDIICSEGKPINVEVLNAVDPVFLHELIDCVEASSAQVACLSVFIGMADYIGNYSKEIDNAKHCRKALTSSMSGGGSPNISVPRRGKNISPYTVARISLSDFTEPCKDTGSVSNLDAHKDIPETPKKSSTASDSENSSPINWDILKQFHTVQDQGTSEYIPETPDGSRDALDSESSSTPIQDQKCNEPY